MLHKRVKRDGIYPKEPKWIKHHRSIDIAHLWTPGLRRRMGDLLKDALKKKAALPVIKPMRRPGSAYSQSRSDQRSGWLSKADGGQQHPWTGGPQSDAPLTHAPGARCFVAQTPAEPDAEFLHQKAWGGLFPLWTCPPKWRSKRARCEHLGILRAGVFPRVVMPWAKSHLICYEPASSCLFHTMLSSSGTRGYSLTVPLLNTPCDFTCLSQGLCIHFLDRISIYPLVFLVILSFGLFFGYPPSSTYLFQLCCILFQMGKTALSI